MLMRPSARRTQIVLGVRHGGDPSVQLEDPRFLVWNSFEECNEAGLSMPPASSRSRISQLIERIRSGSRGLHNAVDASTCLAREIGRALFGLMMRPEPQEDVGLDTPLSVVRIDSLISLRLRNWIRRTLLIEFVVKDIVEAKNIRQLGVLAQRKLKERLEEENWADP